MTEYESVTYKTNMISQEQEDYIRRNKIMNRARRVGKQGAWLAKELHRSMQLQAGSSARQVLDLKPKKSELWRAMFDVNYRYINYQHKVYSHGAMMTEVDGELYSFGFDENGEIVE